MIFSIRVMSPSCLFCVPKTDVPFKISLNQNSLVIYHKFNTYKGTLHILVFFSTCMK